MFANILQTFFAKCLQKMFFANICVFAKKCLCKHFFVENLLIFIGSLLSPQETPHPRTKSCLGHCSRFICISSYRIFLDYYWSGDIKLMFNRWIALILNCWFYSKLTWHLVGIGLLLIYVVFILNFNINYVEKL